MKNFHNISWKWQYWRNSWLQPPNIEVGHQLNSWSGEILLLLSRQFHYILEDFVKKLEKLQQSSNTLGCPRPLNTAWILLKIPSLNSVRHNLFIVEWLSWFWNSVNYSISHYVYTHLLQTLKVFFAKCSHKKASSFSSSCRSVENAKH